MCVVDFLYVWEIYNYFVSNLVVMLDEWCSSILYWWDKFVLFECL